MDSVPELVTVASRTPDAFSDAWKVFSVVECASPSGISHVIVPIPLVLFTSVNSKSPFGIA